MHPRLLAVSVAALALTTAAPALAQTVAASTILAPSLIKPMRPARTHFSLAMREAVHAVAARSAAPARNPYVAAQTSMPLTGVQVRYDYGPTGLGDDVSTFGLASRF